MALLTFPPVGLVALDWHLRYLSQTFTSPLSAARQVLELPGATWVAQVQTKRMTPPQWRDFAAFLADVRGAAGRFRFAPPHLDQPQGAAAGAPVVQSGTGVSLSTTGWVPGGQILRRGDHVTVQTGPETFEMKVITADISAGAGGGAVLPIAPPLRRPPVAGAALIVRGPFAVMALADDDQGRMALAAGPKATCTLSITEAIP